MSNDNLTRKERDELRALAANATATPYVRTGECSVRPTNQEAGFKVATTVNYPDVPDRWSRDADFIVGACNSAVPLLDALEAAEADRDRWWSKLCDVAEALGKVSPEAAPYADQWARKLREERDNLCANFERIRTVWESLCGGVHAVGGGAVATCMLPRSHAGPHMHGRRIVKAMEALLEIAQLRTDDEETATAAVEIARRFIGGAT